jgi:hypothetical protein
MRYLPLICQSCILLLGTAAGQQAAAADTPLTEAIDVTGNRDDINLQLMVDRAEDTFFELFNELVDDEEFRITCTRQAVLGSRISQRICQTAYMKKELTTAANLSYSGVEYQASAALEEKNRQLRKKTVELLEKNPELRNAALNLNLRVEEYRDKYGINAD